MSICHKKQSVDFKVDALIAVNDSTTGCECFRGSTLYELGRKTIDLDENWLESTIQYATLPNRTFEEFQDCFGDQSAEVEDKILEVLSFPRFDHGDGLEELEGSMLPNSEKEIEALCKFLEVPKKHVLRLMLEPDGIEVDKVFEPSDLIISYNALKLGDITAEDFNAEIQESTIEFSVECHMIFSVVLDKEMLANTLRASSLCDKRLGDNENPVLEDEFEGLVGDIVQSMGHIRPD